MSEKVRVLKCIREHCLDCCGGSPKEVRFCTSTGCSLWLLRFGSKPKSAIRRLGSSGRDLLSHSSFIEGGKFAPEKSVSEMES